MLVATADADSAVMKVIELASSTTSRVTGRPRLPTTQPKRRYMIRPRMVSTLGVKTPRKVPNRRAGCCAEASVVMSLHVPIAVISTLHQPERFRQTGKAPTETIRVRQMRAAVSRGGVTQAARPRGGATAAPCSSINAGARRLRLRLRSRSHSSRAPDASIIDGRNCLNSSFRVDLRYRVFQ